MNTLDENWDLFCSKLEQFKRNNNGIVALCPSHNDKNPSLAASYTDEKILVKCQAGCTFKEIVTALGMKQSQFFAPKEKLLSKKIVARYRYEDKEGKLAFSVIRFKPKDFRQQRPDGKWTLEGVARDAIISVDDITSSSIEHVDINTVLTHAAHTWVSAVLLRNSNTV